MHKQNINKSYYEIKVKNHELITSTNILLRIAHDFFKKIHETTKIIEKAILMYLKINNFLKIIRIYIKYL